MEDNSSKLLYLVVAGIYYVVKYVVKNATSSTTEEWATTDEPVEPPSQPVPRENWANTWEEKVRKPPTPAPYLHTPKAMAMARPIAQTMAKPTLQQTSPPKAERLLRRYSGWKKAIIMHEIIQPYAQHAPAPTALA